MDNLSVNGHRQRQKESFIKYGDTFSDHHLLELLLFYAIPRKDVKQIAYNLINRFGSLENVLKADVNSLKEVDGVGESTAVLISLVNTINERNSLNKNRDVKYIKTSEQAGEYVNNILVSSSEEKLILVTLDNELRIIGCHRLAEGTANTSGVNTHKLVSCVISDKAASVIIAHNHPGGKSVPSGADIDFTLKALALLRSIDVKLNDHIIVGEDGITSLARNPKYKNFFK